MRVLSTYKSIKQITNTVSGNDVYRLTIFEGQHFYFLVMLVNRFYDLNSRGNLTEILIINIRSYAVGNVKERSKRNRKVPIILTDLVCLIVRV